MKCLIAPSRYGPFYIYVLILHYIEEQFAGSQIACNHVPVLVSVNLVVQEHLVENDSYRAYISIKQEHSFTDQPCFL